MSNINAYPESEIVAEMPTRLLEYTTVEVRVRLPWKRQTLTTKMAMSDIEQEDLMALSRAYDKCLTEEERYHLHDKKRQAERIAEQIGQRIGYAIIKAAGEI